MYFFLFPLPPKECIFRGRWYIYIYITYMSKLSRLCHPSECNFNNYSCGQLKLQLMTVTMTMIRYRMIAGRNAITLHSDRIGPLVHTQNWLVVYLSFWKIWVRQFVNWDDEIPNISRKLKVMFQSPPTTKPIVRMNRQPRKSHLSHAYGALSAFWANSGIPQPVGTTSSVPCNNSVTFMHV